jgi:hypothetical protein
MDVDFVLFMSPETALECSEDEFKLKMFLSVLKAVFLYEKTSLRDI